MINDKQDEIIKELFHSLLPRYQIGLDTSMKSSNFIFDCVKVLQYKYHRIKVKRGGSDIDSLDWMKTKKTTKKAH